MRKSPTSFINVEEHAAEGVELIQFIFLDSEFVSGRVERYD